MRSIRAKSCVALDVVITFWCTFCDQNVQQNDAVDRLHFYVDSRAATAKMASTRQLTRMIIFKTS